jgi:hypothetical protein
MHLERRTDYKELAKRLEVKAYIPSDSATAVAQERCSGLLEYFHVAVRNASWLEAYDMIDTLVRSAYLQGVNDAARAMVKR